MASGNGGGPPGAVTTIHTSCSPWYFPALRRLTAAGPSPHRHQTVTFVYQPFSSGRSCSLRYTAEHVLGGDHEEWAKSLHSRRHGGVYPFPGMGPCPGTTLASTVRARQYQRARLRGQRNVRNGSGRQYRDQRSRNNHLPRLGSSDRQYTTAGWSLQRRTTTPQPVLQRPRWCSWALAHPGWKGAACC